MPVPEGLNVFAIIQSGGRQVKVTPGSVVTVDRFDAEPGQEVTIDAAYVARVLEGIIKDEDLSRYVL